MRRQTGWAEGDAGVARRWRDAMEAWLEAERDQLGLWLPIGLGAGIAAWFGLADATGWTVALLVSGGLAAGILALGRGGRIGQALFWLALSFALGCSIAWLRSNQVAAPVLARPVVAQVAGRIEVVDRLPARQSVRLTIATDQLPAVLPRRRKPSAVKVGVRSPGLPPAREHGGSAALPPRIRVNVAEADAPLGLAAGARVSLRARLVPPPPPAVPGAYDFARVAWFKGIGATGKALGKATITAPAQPGGASRWLADKRAALTAHIQSRLAGSTGGVAAAFVTGDVGAIDEADADAMRRSGLAHLLSISGLHVAAVIGATMFLTLRLLALSPWLALRAPLLLIAAGAGALAGIAYTLLSGSEVPTVRSCVAALLVLAGIALGREAMTLRLVATGALIVLLFRPEAMVGPSFQLSFAAVTAIVALHSHPKVRAAFLKRDESIARRLARELVSLLATGLLVELALMPIGLYHFHRAGIYGALANIVAIPLTTFVVMPAEALALLLDTVGLGPPVWWVAGKSLALLLWIAHAASSLPGAVTALPSMPLGAFLLMAAGGLWLALWQTWLRRLGLAPIAAGALWALATPAPDLLVTGDGRHLAARAPGGALHLLRPRAGDYVRDTLGWGAGVQEEALDLDAMPGARCGDDACVATIRRGGRDWRLLALRSRYRIDWDVLTRACAWADIALADRRLPRGCAPKWLKLDTATLARTGGMAIGLDPARVATVNGDDRHPWVVAASSSAGRKLRKLRRVRTSA